MRHEFSGVGRQTTGPPRPDAVLNKIDDFAGVFLDQMTET